MIAGADGSILEEGQAFMCWCLRLTGQKLAVLQNMLEMPGAACDDDAEADRQGAGQNKVVRRCK